MQSKVISLYKEILINMRDYSWQVPSVLIGVIYPGNKKGKKEKIEHKLPEHLIKSIKSIIVDQRNKTEPIPDKLIPKTTANVIFNDTQIGNYRLWKTATLKYCLDKAEDEDNKRKENISQEDIDKFLTLPTELFSERPKDNFDQQIEKDQKRAVEFITKEIDLFFNNHQLDLDLFASKGISPMALSLLSFTNVKIIEDNKISMNSKNTVSFEDIQHIILMPAGVNLVYIEKHRRNSISLPYKDYIHDMFLFLQLSLTNQIGDYLEKKNDFFSTLLYAYAQHTKKTMANDDQPENHLLLYELVHQNKLDTSKIFLYDLNKNDLMGTMDMIHLVYNYPSTFTLLFGKRSFKGFLDLNLKSLDIYDLKGKKILSSPHHRNLNKYLFKNYSKAIKLKDTRHHKISMLDFNSYIYKLIAQAIRKSGRFEFKDLHAKFKEKYNVSLNSIDSSRSLKNTRTNTYLKTATDKYLNYSENDFGLLDPTFAEDLGISKKALSLMGYGTYYDFSLSTKQIQLLDHLFSHFPKHFFRFNWQLLNTINHLSLYLRTETADSISSDTIVKDNIKRTKAFLEISTRNSYINFSRYIWKILKNHKSKNYAPLFKEVIGNMFLFYWNNLLPEKQKIIFSRLADENYFAPLFSLARTNNSTEKKMSQVRTKYNALILDRMYKEKKQEVDHGRSRLAEELRELFCKLGAEYAIKRIKQIEKDKDVILINPKSNLSDKPKTTDEFFEKFYSDPEYFQFEDLQKDDDPLPPPLRE
ncbi:hypothetical protein ACFL5G_05835 [Candidatus Margulisiibacteriota bacterium]